MYSYVYIYIKFVCFIQIISFTGKNEITKLVTDKKKQFGPLVRWLKVNFSECFCAWIHVKALRVFVESVLRYYTLNVFYAKYRYGIL